MKRYKAWLGAGLLVVGMGSGMVVGAALAAAEPGGTTTSDTDSPGDDADGGDSNEATGATTDDETPENEVPEEQSQEVSDEGTTEDVADGAVVDDAVVDDAPVDDEEVDDTLIDDLVDDAVELSGDTESAPRSDNSLTQHDDSTVFTPTALPREDALTPDAVAGVDQSEQFALDSQKLAADQPMAVSELPRTVVDGLSPITALAPQAIELAPNLGIPPPHEIPVVNVIGSFIFDTIAFFMRLIEGPPVLPAGSTVTVRRSTLEIDGADGPVVPADWYFPDGSEGPPQGIIYLQHGFLASGPLYSYTAARLAEETNSIVVAPTLSSNVFAADQYWLGGEPMMEAVAGLFAGDREALLASAQAAGYTGEELPEQVVLIGHSLGGGLVTAAAGYMVENGSIDDLAGVIALDGVAFSESSVPRSLTTLRDNGYGDVPIYQLAAPPYLWNLNGQLAGLLEEYRPGQFNGVILDGGTHIDAMQGGNPLIQFGAYLVAGFSQPRNVEAVPILAAGWINDWYDSSDTGIYPAPGTTVLIPVDADPGYAVAIGIGQSAATTSELSLVS